MEKEKTSAELYPQLLLSSQLCFPLYASSRRVVNAYQPLLKPYGLTYTQYVALLALWESGCTTVGELGRRLYLDCGTLTPLLKKMEENGWVTRCRCREDERVVMVTLTEAGWALRDKVADIPRRVGSCIHLPGPEAMELYRLLYALLNSMNEPQEKEETI